MKKDVIIGVSGKDPAYLYDFHLKKNYKVIEIIRRIFKKIIAI